MGYPTKLVGNALTMESNLRRYSREEAVLRASITSLVKCPFELRTE